MASKTLHIIDGSGYIFRAFYAIRPLSNSKGEPTNAIYGFANMIEKAIREEQPEYLAITFDAGGKNFRKDMYAEYKANRPPLPEDLRPQISRIQDVADAFAMAKFVEQGVEADDVIATLTKQALEAGFHVQLITGDKDLMQLVNDEVKLFEPMRNQRFGPAEVEEKFGMPPAKLADALALAGDASDNIPGVRGVGMKTAAKLLGEHGDLQGVLDAAKAGKVKGKMGEKIASSVDEALLSRQLVELKRDVDLSVESLEDLRYQGPNTDALRELYTEFEFKNLIPKLREKGGQVGPAVGQTFAHEKYQWVDSAAKLKALAKALGSAKEFSVAIESDSSQMVDTPVYAIAFATGVEKVFVAPLTEKQRLEDIIRAAQPALEDPNVSVLSHECKRLAGLCLRHGVSVNGLSMDTQLASYLLSPDESAHGYAAVSERYAGLSPLPVTAITGTERKKKTFAEASEETQRNVLGERAAIPFAVRDALAEELKKAEVAHVLADLELPLIPILAVMEHAGVKIDVAKLGRMSKLFAKELERLEAECYEAAGSEFNIGSPKQLQKVLFEDLKLKIIKRTKTGPSTDHSVLEALAGSHPLPEKIIDYRMVQKLKSTYVDALPKMVSEKTGRVHTRFNQSTAATGRLSSTDPNLQNIPIRTELGRELRKAFVAEEGNVLISVDYSQVELRVLAHFSKDEVLCAAFRDGEDVHTRTASVLFEVSPTKVTREQRTQAKAVNFGVLYGMGPVRLARELKIPRKVASQFVKDYFEKQPGVKQFIDETLESARETAQVRTVLGRRRLLPHIRSNNRGERAAAERVAVNTPIQGSAADLIKLAMLRVHAVLKEEHPSAQLLLQVHDELLVECTEKESAAVSAIIQREMEGAFPLEVPLVAQAAVGKNWDEAH